jgi:hypothetical protein
VVFASEIQDDASVLVTFVTDTFYTTNPHLSSSRRIWHRTPTLVLPSWYLPPPSTYRSRGGTIDCKRVASWTGVCATPSLLSPRIHKSGVFATEYELGFTGLLLDLDARILLCKRYAILCDMLGLYMSTLLAPRHLTAV